MERKRVWIVMAAIIILIIAAIIVIEHIQGRNNPEDEALKCIAENSLLYVSKTCSHCAEQKAMLGEGIEYFNMIDCFNEMEKCSAAGVTAVPTWIINNTSHPGVKSIEELKQLTGC